MPGSGTAAPAAGTTGEAGTAVAGLRLGLTAPGAASAGCTGATGTAGAGLGLGFTTPGAASAGCTGASGTAAAGLGLGLTAAGAPSVGWGAAVTATGATGTAAGTAVAEAAGLTGASAAAAAGCGGCGPAGSTGVGLGFVSAFATGAGASAITGAASAGGVAVATATFGTTGSTAAAAAGAGVAAPDVAHCSLGADAACAQGDPALQLFAIKTAPNGLEALVQRGKGGAECLVSSVQLQGRRQPSVQMGRHVQAGHRMCLCRHGQSRTACGVFRAAPPRAGASAGAAAGTGTAGRVRAVGSVGASCSSRRPAVLAGREVAPEPGTELELGLGPPAAAGACAAPRCTGTQFGTSGRDALALKPATMPLCGTMMSRQTPLYETARLCSV